MSTTFNLCNSLHRLLQNVLPAATARGLRLHLHYEPDVPLSFSEAPAGLQSTLAQRLEQAIRQTSRGHIRVRVQLCLDDPLSSRLRVDIHGTEPNFFPPDVWLNAVSPSAAPLKRLASVDLPLPPDCTHTLNSRLKQIDALRTQRLLCVTDDPVLFRDLQTLLGPHVDRLDGHSPPLGAIANTGSYSLLLVDDTRFRLAPEHLRTWIQQHGALGPVIGLSQRPLIPAFIPVSAQLCPPLSPLQLADALDHLLQPAVPDSSSGPKPDPRPKLAGRSVLVAEEHPVNRKVLEILLQQAGAQYRLCQSGAEAIQTLQSGTRFDLVLVGLQMSQMDGYATTRQIRTLPAPVCNIPVIAVTADSREEIHGRCLAAGIDHCLTWPVRRDELQQAAARVLGDSRYPADESEVFDHTALVEQLGGDLGSAVRLVQQFADTLGQDLYRLQQSLDMADLTTASSQAHRIKGGARTLGCAQLAALLQQAETACNRGDQPAAQALLHQIEQQLPGLLERLNAFSHGPVAE